MKRIHLIYSYLKKYKFWGILSLCSGLFSTVAKLLIPFLAGKTISLFINKEYSSPIVIRNLIIITICLLILLVFRYLFEYSGQVLAHKITTDLKNDLLDHYLKMPINQIEEQGSGNLISRLLNDVEQVQNGLLIGGLTFYDGVIAIIVIIIFMFSLNYVLAIITIILSPLSIFAGRYLSSRNSKHFKKQAESNGEISAFTLETLSHSEDISVRDLFEYRYQKFQKINENNKKALFNANMSASTINPLTRLINAIINTCIILSGALLIVNRTSIGITFGVGELIAFITYANSYTQPFNEVSNVASDISFALSSLKRIEDVLTIKVNQKEQCNELKQVNNITFKDISFAYPNNPRTIIQDFSFEIKKGMKIAIVGPTGSGKTTLINLLMRFYDVSKGQIRINDENIDSYTSHSFYTRLGMVLQDSVIFPGTVKDNICYGKKEASEEEIHQAIKKAHLEELINKMKKGLDTEIKDSDSFSLGEKQLICIARVILTNPEVIILDEATSNIDIRSELLLNQSLYELMKDKTSLVVAHRLSTIQNSDAIIVINDGKIEETGTHKELLNKKGFYYQLFNAQFH